MQTRRTLFALAAGLSAAAMLAGCGDGKGTPIAAGEEMSLGKADAPITLIEYASVACPRCGEWHMETFPAFKAKYVDTGQVKFVLREMNAHNPAFSAAGFLLARCAGKEKYFDVVDDIYQQAAEIEASGDFNGGLVRIARENGVSEKAMQACLSDPKAIEEQNNRVMKFAQQDNITGTPSFVIDGEVVAGGKIGMSELDAIIAAAKAKKAG